MGDCILCGECVRPDGGGHWEEEWPLSCPRILDCREEGDAVVWAGQFSKR